jgi:hypothetical protein
MDLYAAARACAYTTATAWKTIHLAQTAQCNVEKACENVECQDDVM